MNDLELFLIKKEYAEYMKRGEYHLVKETIYQNNLQDELTLKDVTFICGVNNYYITFFIISGFDNPISSNKYVSDHPEIIDMKISDIVKIGESNE